MVLKALAAAGVTVAAAGLLIAWSLGWIATGPRLTKRIPWAGTGVWLKAETHVHTKFSDGAFTVDEVAEHAIANGCDALAITDHSDGNLRSATPEYHEAIRAARAK